MEDIKKIISKFYENLDDRGCLFLGYSESLFQISDKFTPVHLRDTVYYKKVLSEAAVLKRKKEEPYFEHRKSDRKKEELAAKRKQFARLKKQKDKKIQGESLYKEAFEYFIKETYNEAMEKIKACLEIISDVPVHLLAGRIYLEKGLHQEAVKECEKALDKDSVDPQIYYVLGLSLRKLNRIAKAIEQFKKVLYLDNSFTMAYFNLAQIYQAEGNKKEALHNYENAVQSLGNHLPEEVLTFSGNFTCGILEETCNRNIDKLRAVKGEG
jgi:chemotaxis protein methyltransferase CheR